MSITWSNHWVGSFFMAKSQFMLNLKPEKRITNCCGAIYRPSFVIPPPKVWSPLPRSAKIRPLYLGPPDIFQKSSLTSVRHWTINSSGRNSSSSQKRRCLNQKTKSAVFAQFRPFFGKIVGAPPFLGRASVSFQEPHLLTQKCNRKWDFLKKRPSGRDMGTFLRAFLDKNNKNGQLADGFTS